MLLLDDVAEVFDLINRDRHTPVGINHINGRLIGTAFVHDDFLRNAIAAHGPAEEALGAGQAPLCRQQKRPFYPPCQRRERDMSKRF